MAHLERGPEPALKEHALFSRPFGSSGGWVALVRDTDVAALFRLRDQVQANAGTGLLHELAIAEWDSPTFSPLADPRAAEPGAEPADEMERRTR